MLVTGITGGEAGHRASAGGWARPGVGGGTSPGVGGGRATGRRRVERRDRALEEARRRASAEARHRRSAGHAPAGPQSTAGESLTTASRLPDRRWPGDPSSLAGACMPATRIRRMGMPSSVCRFRRQSASRACRACGSDGGSVAGAGARHAGVLGAGARHAGAARGPAAGHGRLVAAPGWATPTPMTSVPASTTSASSPMPT